jgi:DNA-binding LacI/PurR family transcriptional regulator
VSTSKDVARVAGVSQTTVSYVINGRSGVAPETRRRVEEAMAQLQYEPNAGARALKNQRTQAVAVMMPFGLTVDRLGVLPFIETFASRARPENHDVLLVTADEGPDGLLRLSRQRLCDAIVLMDVVTEDPRIPIAAELDLPVVVVGVPAHRAGLPCVDLDYELAGALAVDELVMSGHRRVRVLGAPLSRTPYEVNCIRRVQRGAADAAIRRGADFGLASVSETTSAAVAAALDTALGAGTSADDPVGLVVPSRQVLMLLLPVLASRRLRPGRDLSVVAQCEDDMAAAADPPLSNASVEPRAVANRAMDLVFAALRGDPRDGSDLHLVAPPASPDGTPPS